MEPYMPDQKYTPLCNKYTRWYTMLVSSRRAMNRKATPGCGYEKHHIVPKSLGGSNSKENLVVLTPREHCIAHMLLSRMFVGESRAKMCYALMSLAAFRNKNRTSLSSREYDRLRHAYQAALMDPDYRAWRSAQTAMQWTPERRAAVAEKTKKQWETGIKRDVFGSNEYRTKKSTQMKERWQDPEYQRFISETVKTQWQDPTKRPSR
jgi:hypothetical protein